MVASFLRIADLDWPVLDYSALCRRRRILAVQIPYRHANKPRNMLVNSMEINFLGDGERQAPKHCLRGRRQWRKVNLVSTRPPPTSAPWNSFPTATEQLGTCGPSRPDARSRNHCGVNYWDDLYLSMLNYQNRTPDQKYSIVSLRRKSYSSARTACTKPFSSASAGIALRSINPLNTSYSPIAPARSK